MTIHAGYIQVHAGYVAVHAGYIGAPAGYILVHAIDSFAHFSQSVCIVHIS
jgi:hypothetical protein